MRETMIMSDIQHKNIKSPRHAPKPKVTPSSKSSRLSLHGLGFETALRAAMQTGAPPKAKQRTGKRKQKA
jgi:hypothetical protein